MRTYIPERKQKHRRWTDQPVEYEAAFRANRQRVRSEKGRRLNRWRSERCARTFAQVCETGGGRRTWLRGLGNVTQAHVLKCAAYNLGLLLRKVFGLGKPRRSGALVAALLCLWRALQLWLRSPEPILSHWRCVSACKPQNPASDCRFLKKCRSLTGC